MVSSRSNAEKTMRLLVFLFLLNLIISCSENTEQTSRPAQVVNLEGEVLLSKIESDNGVILDVRTKEEIDKGYIVNASFIDFYDPDFSTKASWIKKGQPIFVYCHAGGRSAKAAELLIELGFKNVYNLIGGFSNWKSLGYPIKQGEDADFSEVDTYSVEQVDKILSDNPFTLLVFKTPWCLPCKKLGPVLEKFTKVKENSNILIIDMDANTALAKHYAVSSVPTILAFNNREVFFTHVGYIKLNDLIRSTSR